MKKILMSLAVVLGTTGTFTACTNGDYSKTTPKNTQDSLAYYAGATQGATYNRAFAEMTDEEKEQFNLMDGIDKDAFLLGFKTALDADTANGSYLLGIQEGVRAAQMLNYYHSYGVDINREMLFSLLKDNFNKDLQELPDSLIQQYQIAMKEADRKIQNYVMKIQEQRRIEQLKKDDEEYKANLEVGRKFMSELPGKVKNLVTTQSGLAYEVVKQGEGTPATRDDRVKVNYTGKLIDGTVFDSSEDHGGPATFSPRGVVPGFGEGLTLMAPGSKYVLYIPAELGYNNNKMPNIPMGSTLVFEVEVLEVIPAQAPAAQL